MSAAPFAHFGIAVRSRGPAEQRVACPRCDHGARDDALGVNVETGLFHCFRCGWRGCAANDVQIGPGRGKPRPGAGRDAHDARIAELKRDRLASTWRQSVPLDHPEAHPARTYLTARGLADILTGAKPQFLRANARLPYFENGVITGHFPALVALLKAPDGAGCTLHVTYLKHDGTGKANVSAPKKLLPPTVKGSTRGGAIRFYQPRRGVLGIAEGIENALSLTLLYGIPSWSAFCADNLSQVVLPADISELYIGVDLDLNGTGEVAARKLATRVMNEFSNIKVKQVRPNGAAPRDLNDALRARSHIHVG